MTKSKKRSKKKPLIPEMRGWVTTWNRVAVYLDVNVDTAREYARLGMPVFHSPTGAITIIPYLVDIWLIELHKAEMGMKIEQCFFCKQTIEKGEK